METIKAWLEKNKDIHERVQDFLTASLSK